MTLIPLEVMDFLNLELVFVGEMAGNQMDFQKMQELNQLMNVLLHVKRQKDARLLTFLIRRERNFPVSYSVTQILSLQHHNLFLELAIRLDQVVQLLKKLMKKQRNWKMKKIWLLILRVMLMFLWLEKEDVEEEVGKTKDGPKSKVLLLLMTVEGCVLEQKVALLSMLQVKKKEQMMSLNVSCSATKVLFQLLG